MSVKFVANCRDNIDWFDVITKLQNYQGKCIVPDKTVLTSPAYKELFDLWDTSNFNYSSVQWINYYSSEYGKNIQIEFEKIVGAKHLRSWISKINPGYCAPWHWDVDDDEEEYIEYGKLKRFVCTIGQQHPWHFSVVGNTSLHNSENGDIFLWDNYKEWHAGMNAGVTPKYQYNYLGY